MEEKKEIQKTIVEKKPEEEDVSDEEFYSILKLISPGTILRTALDGIVNSGKGAIIVVENDYLYPIIDGGFKINSRFSAQRLVELSKMDGAIILSKDMKRIIYANTQLNPDTKIKTFETGTRHKAAERTAKHLSGMVIAISERRKEISLFYKNKKYVLKNTSEILRKSNENMQILEKQRELFDNYLAHLNKLEIKNYISLNQAIKTIQRGKVIGKISEELKKNIIELGNEGTLLKTRLKEIISDIEKETNLIVKDYSNIPDYKDAVAALNNFSYEELLNKDNILDTMGYKERIYPLSIKGWRILSKTSLTEPEIAQLGKELGWLDKIINSELEKYIGKEKAHIVEAEIERIKLEY